MRVNRAVRATVGMVACVLVAPNAGGTDAVRGPGSEVRWVSIPAGTFTMGFNCYVQDGSCDPNERPEHRVTISAFQMAETETTIAQYREFARKMRGGAMPTEAGEGLGDDFPAKGVSWHDAEGFCAWSGGRLPTEAEWEYAARGGKRGLKYPWGDNLTHEDANFAEAGGRDRWKGLAPVGQFAPNGYGLYDMIGNATEWVADWMGSYPAGPTTDPKGWSNGPGRVFRGGGYSDYPVRSRLTYREALPPDVRVPGFRCARGSRR